MKQQYLYIEDLINTKRDNVHTNLATQRASIVARSQNTGIIKLTRDSINYEGTQNEMNTVRRDVIHTNTYTRLN